MNGRLRRTAGLAGWAILHLATLLAAPTLAAGGKMATAQQHAISGLWVLDSKGGVGLKATDLPLTPNARAAIDRDEAERKTTGRVLSEDHVKCLPDGMPHMMAAPFAIEILETPGKVTVLAEISDLPRTIFLDRASHTPDLDPSWNGEAIGRWDDDTLVVDTIGFNDRPAHLFNAALQLDRSPKLHIVERLHVGPNGKLVDDMTLDDPKVFTRPYSISYSYRRLPKAAALMEYVCEVDLDTLRAFEAGKAGVAIP